MCRVGIQIHRQCGHEGIRTRKNCPFPHIPLHKSTTRIFLPGRCRDCLTAVWRLATRQDIDFSERQRRHIKLSRPFIDFFYTMISSTDQFPPRMIGYLADISRSEDIDFLEQIRLLLHRDILYRDQACKNVFAMVTAPIGVERTIVADFADDIFHARFRARASWRFSRVARSPHIVACEERLKTIVTESCKRCGQTYGGTVGFEVRRPRKLDCGHAYCIACAKHLVDENNGERCLRCPSLEPKLLELENTMAARQEPREFLEIIRLLVEDFVEVLMPDDVRAARL